MEGISGAAHAATTANGALLDGRYRLLERIGRGGMADVHKAEDTLLHRPVAIKLFRFDLCTPDELRRVHAEMQTLASLQHPGLVTIYDAGTVRETPGDLSSPYLVMQLVGGPNLGRRLTAEGPLGPGDSARLAAELASTLAYVHSRNVVHRDVKPANILLDATIADDAPFVTKLTDFGIARVVDSTHHTEAGFTIGTANYLSPEQALSGEVGTATDVYSLGLVLIECLTGALAYPGTGVEAALARLHRQPPIPASFGPSWHRLLTAATEREPGDRPTAAELAAEFAGLAGRAVTSPVLLAAPVPAVAGPAAGASAADRPLTEDTQAWTPDFVESSGFGGLFAATEATALADTSRSAARRAARRRHSRRTGLVAAAMLVAGVLLCTGFIVRSGHSSGPARTGPTPAAEQTSLSAPVSSPVTHQAAQLAQRSSAGVTSPAATQRPVASVAAPAPVRSTAGPVQSASAPGKPGAGKPTKPGKPGHGKGKH